MTIERLVDDQFVAPDAAEIERALTATWEHAALETRRGGGTPVTRACMGTVVALVAPDADVARVHDVLMEWSGEYPARSIVVCLDDTPGRGGIDASFSAACRLPESGGRQMCSEVIRLSARGAATAHVSATILGLLVSDLPVTVWCVGAGHGDLAHLAPVLDAADHIVIDSAQFLSGYGALHWMNAAGLAERRARVVDLTWLRTFPWRRLVAELFDGPEARAAIENIAHVSVTGRPAVSASALLLVGWIISRLQWSVSADPRARERSVIARGAAQECAIAFREALTAVVDQPVQDIALRIAGATPGVYLVRRAPDGATVEASVAHEGTCPVPRTLHAPPQSVATLLHTAVVRSTQDPAYRDALAAAHDLMRALGATGRVEEDA